MNQFTGMFLKSNNQASEPKVESKEEFFSTKKKLKRMKSSTCFSETIEKIVPVQNHLDLSLGCLH